MNKETSKAKISATLHLLAALAGNGSILLFVPVKYKETALIVCNALIGISAWFDKTFGDHLAGRA